MGQNLNGKNVIVGVTGGIAAYKSAELVRLLIKAGAQVEVVLSDGAKAFITAMTFQALTGRPVRDSLWNEAHEAAMGHIELARWADMIIIAPASANTLAKLSGGHASCLLSTLILATKAVMYLCPAMNQQMFRQSITQENLQRLANRGMTIIGPDSGEQACGDIGPGRMVEPVDIINVILTASAPLPEKLLNGLKVVLTAGPTREPIDPVRYLTNRSSGKMGYAFAKAALDLGADVVLVSGPVSLVPVDGIKQYRVETAKEMHQCVFEHIHQADIFIATAAVSDYALQTPYLDKIKKHDETLTLSLVKNPDIVADVAALENRPYVIGFAAETQNVKAYALSKLENKRLDMIICNEVSRKDIGFDSDDNEVNVFTHKEQKAFAKQAKARLAYELLEYIAKDYRANHEKRYSNEDIR